MPTQLDNLDPKLKEAYDRVMSATGSPSSPPPTSAEPAKTEIHVVSTQPPATPSTPSTTNVSTPTGSVIATGFVAGASGTAEGQTAPKPKISPVILLVAAVAFFIIYTLFWVMFFQFPIPFISG